MYKWVRLLGKWIYPFRSRAARAESVLDSDFVKKFALLDPPTSCARPGAKTGYDSRSDDCFRAENAGVLAVRRCCLTLRRLDAMVVAWKLAIINILFC